MWAINHNCATVGFIEFVSAGKGMVFGAALSIENLDYLAVVDKMAKAMGCPPRFEMSEWADVRLSLPPQPLRLPARRALILPLNWQLNDAVLVHFATTELTSVTQDGNALVLRGQQDDFSAMLTLKGYSCEQALNIEKSAESQQIWIRTHDGTIRLIPA